MTTDDKINLYLEIMWKKYGLLYRWGSKGPVTYDCSGVVSEALKSVGYLRTDCCLTAQAIFETLSKSEWSEKLQKGSVVFFGKSLIEITHVGIAINEQSYIGASSGDHTTVDDSIAIQQNAYVKVRPLRHDIVACLFPKG
jgi:cell wall-associated NlpC family hydrolase